MHADLAGCRVAVLAAAGEAVAAPVEALRAAGAEVAVIAPAEAADPHRFDALLLATGPAPSPLPDGPATRFVRHFVEEGKPIAALAHGFAALIAADGVRGLRVTSAPALRAVLTSAGAQWVDAAAVADRGLVTGRRAADLPTFVPKMIAEFRDAWAEARIRA